MKPIKEKLDEHLSSMQDGGCIPNYEEDDFNAGNMYGFEQGFIAGVEFARRWIDIDEELPEENSNVAVKVFPSGCQGRYHYDIALFRGGNFYIGNYPDADVSFWRHIELK
jgi:hypothetical protein